MEWINDMCRQEEDVEKEIESDGDVWPDPILFRLSGDLYFLFSFYTWWIEK